MKDKNSRQNKRIKKLIVGCTFAAIVLIASTYAWFIGMKTVNVSSFDVTIATTDGLSLSLDGKKWLETVAISESNYNDTVNTVYTGHTNSWGGEGLIPMSSVGKIDTTKSRLIMFEKGSLTTTPGGYRLMASRVTNDGATEQDGYVAFDLFIKNLSGTEYYGDLNKLNEEAIYLTTDSQVTVASDGEANTGIENSVRVAFAQIGRVKGTTTDQSTITGITCSSTFEDPETRLKPIVTGICEDRDAQIWEPNDTEHVTNAINWYTTSCLKRADSTLTNYSGACGEVKQGGTYPTYAVSGVIDHTHKVDVYDGKEYNGYEGSTATSAQEGKLVAFNYFTDTEKNYEGVKRPEFFSLAPNSITKVRVYIYIEGQDIDNYDFASLGKKITVNFGFTKERFFGEDVDYESDGTATLPNDVIKSSHTTSRSTISSAAAGE